MLVDMMRDMVGYMDGEMVGDMMVDNMMVDASECRLATLATVTQNRTAADPDSVSFKLILEVARYSLDM